MQATACSRGSALTDLLGEQTMRAWIMAHHHLSTEPRALCSSNAQQALQQGRGDRPGAEMPVPDGLVIRVEARRTRDSQRRANVANCNQ
jgi:hypothetical protein